VGQTSVIKNDFGLAPSLGQEAGNEVNGKPGALDGGLAAKNRGIAHDARISLSVRPFRLAHGKNVCGKGISTARQKSPGWFVFTKFARLRASGKT
jgi:hypothetical protein